MRVAMMLVTALGAGMIAHAAWMNVARGMASEGDGGVSLAPSTALECIVGLFFCMLGVLNLAGELKPITASASEQSAEMLYYRPDFAHFQHRSFVTRST